MSAGRDPNETLDMRLRALKLPAFVAHHAEVAEKAEKQGWSFGQYLDHLTEIECVERRTRKVGRLLKQSGLPSDKTLGTLEEGRLPVKVRRQIPTLCESGFVERAENVLAFGLPGRGESHLLCGIAREIVDRGYAVLFTPAYRLVQRLLAAKRDLDMVGFALCKQALPIFAARSSHWLSRRGGENTSKRSFVDSTPATSCSSTTSATSNRTARRWKSFSRFSPSATRGGAS